MSKIEINEDLALPQIEALLIKNAGKCASCGKPIKKGSIKSYDHEEGGTKLKNFEKKQWIYFHCVCGYDSALWKVMKQLK